MTRINFPVLVSNFLILSVLTGVTIYDVYLITDDYLNDNRVTLVTWKTLSNSTGFPFLNDAWVRICVYMDKNATYFQELWGMPNVTVYNKRFDYSFNVEYYKNATKRIERLMNSTTALGSLSLEERLDAMYVFRSLRAFDDIVLLDASWGTTFSTDLNTYGYLNGVSQNSSFLRELRSTVWRHLERSIIARDGDSAGFVREKTIKLGRLDIDEVCIDLNLGIAVTPYDSLTRRSYAISVVQEDLRKRFPNVTGDVTITWTGNQTYSVDISPSNPQRLILSVTNQGVFDRRQTTTNCRNEPDTYLLANPYNTGYRTTLESCRDRLFVDTLVDTCDCVLFTDGEDFKKVDSRYNYTICTQSELQRCGNKFIENFKTAEQKLQCPPLCTEDRNEYSFSVSSHDALTCLISSTVDITDPFKWRKNETVDECAQLILHVECHDNGYMSYVEKKQSTLTQFLGQVGGDIGLYTGLSVLSVWQLFTTVYAIYRKRRANRENGEESSFLQLALREMGIVEDVAVSATTTTTTIMVQPAAASTALDTAGGNSGERSSESSLLEAKLLRKFEMRLKQEITSLERKFDQRFDRFQLILERAVMKPN